MKFISILLFTLSFLINHSQACSCLNYFIDEMSLSEYYEYEIISKVKVIEIFEKKDTFMGWNTRYVKVDVIEDYKKELPTEIFQNGGNMHPCSFRLEVGVTYILYSMDSTSINIGFCNRINSNKGEFEDKFNNTKSFLDKMNSPRKIKTRKFKYKNGQRMAKGKLKNRKPVGLWEYYYPDGTLWKRGKYVNGVKSGLWEENELRASSFLYKDHMEGVYENGRRIGIWEIKSIDDEDGLFNISKEDYSRQDL